MKYQELAQEEQAESSASIRSRVLAARQRQFRRLAPFKIFCNAEMTPQAIRRFCKLDSSCRKLMEHAITRIGLSARAYERILRVSLTMADLEGSDRIDATHVSEAIQYRNLDHAYW